MSQTDSNPDLAVREIEASRPALREDLRWTVQEVREQASYLLEDPLSGKFYRLGRQEYEFSRRLDGRRTVSSLVAVAAKGDSGFALSAEDADALVRMLADAGLLRTLDSAHADRLWDEVSRPHEGTRVLGKISQVLFLKVPLCNPDRFFSWTASRFGWLLSPVFALAWLATLLLGAYSIYDQKERFFAQMSGLFDFGNLWILGGLWILLKAFHECWHGLACRRFGGAVPEAGFSLLVFATPLGYVNASSSAAFSSRWHRMIVSAAGMYGELFLAAIAAIVWSHLDPGVASATLHRVIMLSSITTVFFNANPLMRFDGYYLLSDGLDIPNLYEKGQKFVSWFFRYWLLGMTKARCPLKKGGPRVSIALYGFAAWVWKILLMTGILVATALLFQKVGLVIALVTGGAMLLQSANRTVEYFKKSAASEGLRPVRAVLRVSILVVAVVFGLFYVQVTPSSRAPAVVRDLVGGETRVNCPGFLTDLYVAVGDHVEAGDLLARLTNPEETGRLQGLETEIARSRVLRDIYLEKGEIAAAQAEARNLAAVESIVEELREYVASLEIRAPRAGIVDGRHPELLVGTWIEKGRELLSVVDGGKRELVLLVAEEDKASFESALTAQRSISFRPRGRWGSWNARLVESVPRASTDPVHFALVSAAGGPLAVRHRLDAKDEDRIAKGADSEEVGARYELVDPRFEFHADLEKSEGILRVGEMGKVVAIGSESRSLADLTSAALQKYFEHLQRR